MENATDILDYLPITYKSQEEQDYINFLWESFECNYENGKFPFAYIAFHMIYMSFVYFEVWKVKENRKNVFENAMIGFNKDIEKNLLNATTPFAFWEIGESNFFRFLKLIGCDNNRIGNYKKSVDDRNNSAHSNGRVLFNDKITIDNKTKNILTFINEIQINSHSVIEECLIKFLKENLDSKTREYIDNEDQIREILINRNYLSQKDVNYLLTFDIKKLSEEKDYKKIRKLYKSFVEMYKE